MGYLDLAIHTAETLMHGMLNRSGEPIVVSHQSQQLSLPYWQLNKRISWLDWSNYLCQAIARRAHSSVELLMQFTPQMAAEYTSEPREYTAFYVRYLQGMLAPTADHDALQQEFTEVHAREFHLRFRVALAPFYCLAKEDEAGFEAAMLRGSNMHRAYVKKVSNKMTMDPLGFYPPQLMAAASLAYDRHGWTLKHKSDYLPKWWIYNTFEAPVMTD
ncbi:immunity 49 family protein [Shewanella youngdeokensis]|uniref:Immunity 49 family protein n=1 Tax=Shewanella youngdeokensis TaxID=2999068 RepID=A0ABZ0K3R3_9GAMM|nr:immunity 49 family protein [Shewanella sp. DAU334]